MSSIAESPTGEMEINFHKIPLRLNKVEPKMKVGGVIRLLTIFLRFFSFFGEAGKPRCLKLPTFSIPNITYCYLVLPTT